MERKIAPGKYYDLPGGRRWTVAGGALRIIRPPESGKGKDWRDIVDLSSLSEEDRAILAEFGVTNETLLRERKRLNAVARKRADDGLQKLYDGLYSSLEAYNDLCTMEGIDQETLEDVHETILKGLKLSAAMSAEIDELELEELKHIERFVSTTEAGRLMGYSTDHVNLLCREGKLPGAKKIGRNWLVPRADVEAYKPGPQGFAAHPENNPNKRGDS